MAGSDDLGLLGDSPAMAELRLWLPKVARSPATVLVTGETGTGKERVAEAVHRLSPRAAGPFVALNCAAIPEALVESELFGHERGAFTGAHQRSIGHMVAADGGTLFLDEVGEMPMAVQAKLLRALETREIRPVGSSQTRRVDIRIVAATNRTLSDMVACGQFRADLFYRLNVALIELPPLRDRPEDLPALLSAALAQFGRRIGRAIGPPDGELLECLEAHDWPGNVRELFNLAEALTIDPPDGRIGLRHLPPSWRRRLEHYRGDANRERDRLVDALASAHWNKAEAAKTLNWSRMTLYRKLERYRIEKPPG
jgi:DNA-binding NtrC family response regulator